MLLFPVGKIVSIMWKSAQSRQSRMPSTVLECLDHPPPKTRGRKWFVIVLTLSLTYSVYRTSTIGALSSKKLDSIEVVRTAGPVSTCGRSCNLEEFTNKTKINLTDIPIIDAKEAIPTRVCEINMTGRGKININRNIKLDAYDHVLKVRLGGYYRPSTCLSRHKLAIIVPYRNREKNLVVFLSKIHPFLINQNLEYRMFVVEQSGTQKFNKGRLFNAGFEQVRRFGNWSCLVFHDADLLPLDQRILYTCPHFPRHMSSLVVECRDIPDYNSHFGGVTAMTAEHFLKVNGYSNMYWGWGGEDFDMFWRLRLVGLPVVRYDREIAQYTMLPHLPEPKNPRRHALVSSGFRQSRYKTDGLSTLVYKVVFIRLRNLFTHIVVDVNPDNDITE